MAPYIKQEEIGRGSWSTVYKGVDALTGEVVAIKELAKAAGMPKREVELALKITHKNVCRVHALYQEDDEAPFCIAMEYVDGGNLRQSIARSGPLSVETTLSIAMQILDGLEAVHEHLVHLDLKPENIL